MIHILSTFTKREITKHAYYKNRVQNPQFEKNTLTVITKRNGIHKIHHSRNEFRHALCAGYHSRSEYRRHEKVGGHCPPKNQKIYTKKHDIRITLNQNNIVPLSIKCIDTQTNNLKITNIHFEMKNLSTSQNYTIECIINHKNNSINNNEICQ